MLLFGFGLLLALIYCVCMLPQTEGGNPTIKYTLYPIVYNSMIIVPYSNSKAIHIHHWVICLTFVLLAVIIHVPTIVTGFSFGMFINGFCYTDRFSFICDNPYSY